VRTARSSAGSAPAVREVGLAEQNGVTGGEPADDLILLAAGDGAGDGGQGGAGIPLGGAEPGTGAIRDLAIELLDPEALGLLPPGSLSYKGAG
jgi:hypothetical protein